MMKPYKSRKSRKAFMFAVLVLAPAAALTGCTTSAYDWRKPVDLSLSDQADFEFSRDRFEAAPEDPALLKTLPEMTAEDYEASGDAYLGNEDYTMAFVQYEKSLALNADNVNIYYKQGLLFLHAGRHEDAVKSFQQVLEKEPGRAAALEGMGIAFFEMHKYDEAENRLLKALELDPGLWKARNYLGNIYDFQKKYDRASREYAEAILLRPDKGSLHNNLGVSLSLAGRHEEAIDAFRRALGAKGPKERVYNNLGLVLARTGRYDAALSAFMKGSGSAKAYNNLGCVHLSQGDYREAARAFNRAIELSPEFYEKAHDNLQRIQLETAIN